MARVEIFQLRVMVGLRLLASGVRLSGLANNIRAPIVLHHAAIEWHAGNKA
jgi:hypothetical protein